MNSIEILEKELFPNHVRDTFFQNLATIEKPKVLELGTLQWQEGVSTHHGELLPGDAIHIKCDIEAGSDVDIVSDAHDLAAFEDGEFDAFIAIWVWEHLRKPWIAADAVARILKSGGLVFIQTCHTFPVHGYPSDYCRWTDKGLEALFDVPFWQNQQSCLTMPCVIKPPEQLTGWNEAAPAYLNVSLSAVRS
jgi:SAM-dependent methyltransferase